MIGIPGRLAIRNDLSFAAIVSQLDLCPDGPDGYIKVVHFNLSGRVRWIRITKDFVEE